MFETLSGRFDSIFSKIRSKGKLSETDVDSAMREIRLALIEADVNSQVARNFVNRLKENLIGKEITKSLSPSQEVIKCVNEELVRTLGGSGFHFTYSSSGPTVILLAGLQGSGKTTTSAKLANYFKHEGRSPMLVALDLKRPAAIEQLKVLGNSIDVPVFTRSQSAPEVARLSIQEAKRLGKDVVILDTAGRLGIDEEMMEEISSIYQATSPKYTFFVVDAMMGQDALLVANAFKERLDLNGIILTKLDGDARGGAALSVVEVVGAPIVFSSTGEKIDDFGPFYPDRMASRILGMGDVLTLIEKAQRAYDKEVAEKTAQKLAEGQLTLEDFLIQMREAKKLGPITNLLSMMPSNLVPAEAMSMIDDKAVNRVEAIISSMTPQERLNPKIIDASRRTRIAKGAGVSPAEVSQLITQFSQAQKALEQMGILGKVVKSSLKRAKKKSKKKSGGRVTPKNKPR